VSYDPDLPNCRYNNTTTQINEVVGEIPEEWDNLTNFDRDARPGRITADGFVTRFGNLNLACVAPGPDCHPLKLVAAFTGRYGTQFLLSPENATNHPLNLPERDIYFCGGQVCSEGDPGATPSGWLGQTN
jgi:hypothetical protein